MTSFRSEHGILSTCSFLGDALAEHSLKKNAAVAEQILYSLLLTDLGS